MKIKEKTAWEKVLIARNINRPKSEDYIKNIFKDFIELLNLYQKYLKTHLIDTKSVKRINYMHIKLRKAQQITKNLHNKFLKKCRLKPLKSVEQNS